MPAKIEAVSFVADPARTLQELQVACQQAELDTSGSLSDLRVRLMDYIAAFTDQDDLVCLNPEPPPRDQ